MKKRMNMKKKLGVAVAAMVMTTSMSMTALAVPNPQPGTSTDNTPFNQNNASTTVNMVGMTDTEINGNLSATLPLAVRLAVMGNGDIMGPNNYMIRNITLNKGIQVVKIAATPEANFLLSGTAGTNQLMIGDIDLHPQIGTGAGSSIKLSLMDSTNGTNGFDTNRSDWTLLQVTGSDVAQTEANIVFGGNVDVTKLPANVTGNAAGAKAFTLKFTIGLAP